MPLHIQGYTCQLSYGGEKPDDSPLSIITRGFDSPFPDSAPIYHPYPCRSILIHNKNISSVFDKILLHVKKLS
jgi:hypothetical protein